VAKTDIPVPIGDAATSLGVLESQMEKWIREDKPKILKNHRGVLSVPQSYITTCSSKSDYYKALLNSIQIENKHKLHVFTGEEKDQLYKSRQAMLKVYRQWADRIEEIHKDYKNVFNELSNETWEFASYMLLSRAIGLLKGAIELLSKGYWYAGSIIREVDETLDVAQYFKIRAQSGDHTDLKKWFRTSVAPGHSKCRKAIAEHYASIVYEANAKKHEYLLNELYQKKSKWTHPNFGLIRESGSFEVIDGKLQIKKLCYGECEHEFKVIELVDYFKSSIWTMYQQFMVIFIDFLSVEHRKELLEFNKLQQKI
jgi:DNA-binding ferritin-like protein (Dps family)